MMDCQIRCSVVPFVYHVAAQAADYEDADIIMKALAKAHPDVDWWIAATEDGEVIDQIPKGAPRE